MMRGLLFSALAALLAASAAAQDVLIQGATVLTVAKGRIEGGDILVRGGKIQAVGRGLRAPEGVPILDAKGLFAMPGIVDAHAHFAMEGGTNELTLSVTAMVSVGDILNPDDVNLRRRLADGVTTANLLHGSGNAIGGTSAVIKLRVGADAKGLRFEGALPGIKFALGENPKRSNFTPPGVTAARYPATRMGVMDVIRQAFVEARAYRQAWRDFEARAKAKDPAAVPPRRDLALEPLVEVLEGRRLVHAHCYRSDEIVQLLKLADEFGFRIATLQHALEAYKVVPEILKHGAGVSTFSDRWGYKVEAFDAIPQNAALCARAGILTSINSDFPVVPRLLNQEAARAGKYGGLSEDETLALVTLNPARQLGIGHRVGSLEAGKDADIVLYDQPPLSIYAVPQKVLVDGRILYDRARELEERPRLEAERLALKERLGKEAKEGADAPKSRATGAEFLAHQGTLAHTDDHPEQERP